MNILLDTCMFLWFIFDTPVYTQRAERIFSDPGNTLYLSTVSAWEIALKYSRGKIILREPPEILVPMQRERHGIESLPLNEEAVLFAHRLPEHHKDPFDRMLVCQALAYDLTIMTPDRLIAQYPVPVIW